MTIRLLFFLLLLLTVAASLRPLTRKLYLPAGLVLIVIGYVIGQLASYTGIDTGLRWQHFPELILNILLPLILFRAALETSLPQLRQHATTLLLLVFPLMILMLCLTACLLYYGIHHSVGFPWLAAFMSAALLMATEADIVSPHLERIGRMDVAAILNGESFLSDTTVVVIFSLFLNLAVMSPDVSSSSLVAGAGGAFLYSLINGILIGLAMGLIQRWLLKVTDNSVLLVMSSILVLYVTYLLTSKVLHGSGVVAVIVLGMILLYSQTTQNSSSFYKIKEFWATPTRLAESLVYLLAGVSIVPAMFQDRWLAMLLAIGAVLIARTLAVKFLLPVIQRKMGIRMLDRNGYTALNWGATRGVVILALALSLPLTVDYWYTVQSIAYGVVLFSLFVQGGGMFLWLGLQRHH